MGNKGRKPEETVVLNELLVTTVYKEVQNHLDAQRTVKFNANLKLGGFLFFQSKAREVCQRHYIADKRYVLRYANNTTC